MIILLKSSVRPLKNGVLS